MRDRSGARESRERWLERQAEWREQQVRALLAVVGVEKWGQLVDDVCEAEETISYDELEAAAEEYRRTVCRFCGLPSDRCTGSGFDDGIQAHDFAPGGVVE